MSRRGVGSQVSIGHRAPRDASGSGQFVRVGQRRGGVGTLSAADQAELGSGLDRSVAMGVAMPGRRVHCLSAFAESIVDAWIPRLRTNG